MKYISALAGIMMATTAMAGERYVTGSVGTHATGTGNAVLGVALGMEAHKNLRVEAAYEYDVDNKSNKVFAHVLPQAKIPNTVLTPYLLVGVGVDFESIDSKPLYALGAGVRVELTKSMDLDLRYRRVDNTDNTDKREVVSAGVSVKF